MIRVGIVGFGMGGRVFHGPLVSSVEGLELAAVLERSTSYAAGRYPGIKTFRSLYAMLADASLTAHSVAKGPQQVRIIAGRPARLQVDRTSRNPWS